MTGSSERIPINWRTGPDRNLVVKSVGWLPNPGEVFWVNGRFWISHNGQLRQPNADERKKINQKIFEGEFEIPHRKITKIPR